MCACVRVRVQSKDELVSKGECTEQALEAEGEKIGRIVILR
jgi:hypothetical protein